MVARRYCGDNCTRQLHLADRADSRTICSHLRSNRLRSAFRAAVARPGETKSVGQLCHRLYRFRCNLHGSLALAGRRRGNPITVSLGYSAFDIFHNRARNDYYCSIPRTRGGLKQFKLDIRFYPINSMYVNPVGWVTICGSRRRRLGSRARRATSRLMGGTCSRASISDREK